MDFPNQLMNFVNKEKYIQELNSFLKLEINWDGYNAIPINQEVFENTLYFLNNTICNYITDMFPNPNGTVTIEIETQTFSIGIPIDNIFSIEIGQLGYSYFIKNYGCDDILVDGKDLLNNIETINKHIEEFINM